MKFLVTVAFGLMLGFVISVSVCYKDGQILKDLMSNVMSLGKATAMPSECITTETSWYSRKECCTPANPNALMANTEPLDDSAFTCASWDYDFGTKLHVSNPANQHGVWVTVTDRGPAKRLYRQGRKLDLSKAAFEALAPLSVGVINVEIRP